MNDEQYWELDPVAANATNVRVMNAVRVVRGRKYKSPSCFSLAVGRGSENEQPIDCEDRGQTQRASRRCPLRNQLGVISRSDRSYLPVGDHWGNRGMTGSSGFDVAQLPCQSRSADERKEAIRPKRGVGMQKQRMKRMLKRRTERSRKEGREKRTREEGTEVR